MKFLFVGSSPDHGGAETHFIALAQALSDAGHGVDAMVHPHGFITVSLPTNSNAAVWRRVAWHSAMHSIRVRSPFWRA